MKPGTRGTSADMLVVISTYNEVANLPHLVEALVQLSFDGARLRVMIVDDNSPDGTGQLADKLAERYPGQLEVLHRKTERGLGGACIEGFARALEQGPDLIAQMDADLSHDPAVLVEMVRAIERADVVIGSRYVDGSSLDRRWPRRRKALSWFANRIAVPVILSVPMRDTTSGYRLWRREALMKVDPKTRVRSRGFGFLIEMAYLATRLGCRIEEVPIHYRWRDAGGSKMTLAVQVAAMRDLFSIMIRHRMLGALQLRARRMG